MEQYLSFSRLKQQYVYEWIVGKKSFMYASLAYTASIVVFLIFSILFSDGKIEEGFHSGLLNFVLFLGVPWMALRSFKDINDRMKVMHYMSIPSASEEKFLVKWSTSLFGFVAWVLALHFIITLVAQSIWHIFDINTFASMPEFSWYGTTILNLMFLHAYFFLGGALFQKHPILKLLLLSFVISIGILILTFVLDTFDIVTGLIHTESSVTIVNNGDVMTQTNTHLPEGGWIDVETEAGRELMKNFIDVSQYVFALLFWGIGYRRFKTVQA